MAAGETVLEATAVITAEMTTGIAREDTDRVRQGTGRSAQIVGSATMMMLASRAMIQIEHREMHQGIETRVAIGQKTGMGGRTATAKTAGKLAMVAKIVLQKETVEQREYGIGRKRLSSKVRHHQISIVCLAAPLTRFQQTQMFHPSLRQTNRHPVIAQLRLNAPLPARDASPARTES